MRNIAEALRHQTEEVGVIKPCLQDVGPEMTKSAGKSEQPMGVGRPSSQSERDDFDAGFGKRPPDRPGVPETDDDRAEPLLVHAPQEAGEHPLSAPGREASDQVNDRGHYRFLSGITLDICPRFPVALDI